MDITAEYLVNADGTGTARYTLDGREITAAEYVAIQAAAIADEIDRERAA